jgi:hypothetical protein
LCGCCFKVVNTVCCHILAEQELSHRAVCAVTAILEPVKRRELSKALFTLRTLRGECFK